MPLLREHYLNDLVVVVRETPEERFAQTEKDRLKRVRIVRYTETHPNIPEVVLKNLNMHYQFLGQRIGWWQGKEDATRRATYFAGRRIGFLSNTDYYPRSVPPRLYFIPNA